MAIKKIVIFFFVLIVSIGFFRFIITQYQHRSKASENPKPLSILLPLYKYPEYQYWAKNSAGICPSLPVNIWDDVSRVAIANPRVPIVAIVNPANGPGANGIPDANYVCAMNDLSTATNIKMIGYIHTRTNPASCDNLRSINELKTEIGQYRVNFPHVTGIFVDEVCNGNLTYYQNLNKAIKEAAPLYDLVVLNPGTIIDSNYITNTTGDTGNLFVVYEGLSTGWNSQITTSQIEALNTPNKSTLIYGESSLANAKLIVDMTKLRRYSHIYVTDDVLVPNPWDTLPAYWNDLVGYINSSNENLSSSSSSAADGSSMVCFNVTEDSYVRWDDPQKNYGSEVILNVGGYKEHYGQMLSYIKFNTNQFPSQFTRAYLKVYESRNDLERLATIYMHKVQSSWNESTLTWNNKPQYEINEIASLHIDSHEINASTPFIREFEMTNYLKNNNTIPFGVMFRETHYDQTKCDSRDSVPSCAQTEKDSWFYMQSRESASPPGSMSPQICFQTTSSSSSSANDVGCAALAPGDRSTSQCVIRGGICKVDPGDVLCSKCPDGDYDELTGASNLGCSSGELCCLPQGSSSSRASYRVAGRIKNKNGTGIAGVQLIVYNDGTHQN